MATVTLTPTKYYQVIDSVVTNIDPEIKRWNTVYNASANMTTVVSSVIAEFDIPEEIRRDTATQTKVTITGISNLGGNTSHHYLTPKQIPYVANVVVGQRIAYVSGTGLGSSGGFDSRNTTVTTIPGSNSVKDVKTKLWIRLFVRASTAYTSGEYRSTGEFTGASIQLETAGTSIAFTPLLSPTSGYINPKQANNFTVTAEQFAPIIMNYTAQSAVLHWKLSTGSAYSDITSTTNVVTLPADTWTTGQSYDVYVTATADDGTVADSAVYTFSTVDAIPTVTPISPINTITYGEVTFRWSYSVSTGANQYAFDIQTSSDGQTWDTLADHVVSTDTSYTVNYPHSGTVYWQVRGYNQDNVASEWSDAVTFVNNIPPEPPVITSVTASGRPAVTWSASDQIAYQVQILNGDEVVEDSGAVYSAQKQYQTQDYLPDGLYTVRVRIYNVYGKMSEWAETTFTQSSSLTPPAFTLTGSTDGILVHITTDPTFSIYYIKRNGVTIGQTTDGMFIDRYSNGTNTYTVIGVTSDGMSAQSTQEFTHIVKSNILVNTDGQVFYVNHRMGSPVGVSKQVNATYDQANYIGASLPEHHFAKLIEGRFTVTFKDYVNTENLLGQTMFYADMYGNGAWVAVVSIGRTENRYGNETSAELQLTTYDEEISYA